MSILSGSGLGLSFGARDIFSNISFELPHGTKVGLVGPNGIGKTSLFRIIAGLQEATAGTVHLARDTRIGYLAQEAVEAFAGHEHSVYDEMLTVFAPLQEQEGQLRSLEAAMAEGDVRPDVLERYGTVQERFERAGGYDYETRIAQTLDGLGFDRGRWNTTMSHLSGGQKTRALLARLLLESPDLLILDEPTNHLDVEAIEWLERALRTWPGALLVASHDRFFLDRVVNRIWEMSDRHIETYRADPALPGGGYSAYVRQRQERWERNQKVFDAEMQRLRTELETIRRYHAWRKFDEAWGRLKRLSRELKGIERWGLLALQDMSTEQIGVHRVKMMTIEEAHEAIKRIRPPTRPPQLHVRLQPSSRSGDIVLRTHDLQVGYDGRALLACDDIRLSRLERVALIGPNGSGKTTFLRTVMGELQPVAGTVSPGAGLRIGYFAQGHDSLNRENTVLDELLHHRNLPLPEARNYLARYLFRGEDVYKQVGALSGGERGRLALAVLTLQGVNVLLLDEPTNHLDIPTREVLQESLEAFDGTIILVTHDRYLVSELATQIWELRDGRLHVFRGTYAELLESRRPAPAPKDERGPVKVAAEPDDSARERALAELEEEIARVEAALARYSKQLETCHADRDVNVAELAHAYGATEAELRRLLERWEMAAV
jgi:ATP-binding cassette subfamily F protein 3